jgi:ABC transporter substrate binding protein
MRSRSWAHELDAAVDTEHVVKALTAIWYLKAPTAWTLRGRIERILDAAKVEGLRTGENPARWRGHLQHLLPSKAKIHDGVDLFRRAAAYVDRILRGAKPPELPVQLPTKFEMVVNLKTAKALGVAIPPNLLAIADEGDRMRIDGENSCRARKRSGMSACCAGAGSGNAGGRSSRQPNGRSIPHSRLHGRAEGGRLH